MLGMHTSISQGYDASRRLVHIGLRKSRDAALLASLARPALVLPSAGTHSGMSTARRTCAAAPRYKRTTNQSTNQLTVVRRDLTQKLLASCLSAWLA